MDADLLLAIQLQEQFDNEYKTAATKSEKPYWDGFEPTCKRRKTESLDGGSGVVPFWNPPNPRADRPLSIVDESWEMLDPNPDVRSMFLEFNDMFFWGKLSGVEVKWSPRMTLCAGVCSYEGRGGLCSIRLSVPLLKLRPRKDLVETLLHEMIHALLFVTQNNRDRDGHGPEFCKHMHRINKASGTKITVYHSFHDEVDVYRQHWWRCNGPCQQRRPYFGFVKRAMNRAPSSMDPWWEEHQRTCGGTYTKVKEPEGYSQKSKKDGKKEKKSPGNGKPSNTTKGNTALSSGSQDIRNVVPFSGRGFLLGAESQPSSVSASVPLASPKSWPPPSPKPATAASSSERKPKRSVGNGRIFVSINGSPVKLPKARSSGGGADKFRQRSIQDLFSGTDVKKAASEAKNPPPTSPRSSERASAAPTPSTPLADPGAAAHASRKRPWDERSGSAGVLRRFLQPSGDEPASAKASAAPDAAACSLPTVSCPVCHAKVQEPKINQHLDSCLS